MTLSGLRVLPPPRVAERHHENAVEPPHRAAPPARVERLAPRVERAVRGGGGGYGGRRSGRVKRRQWIFVPGALRSSSAMTSCAQREVNCRAFERYSRRARRSHTILPFERYSLP
jgi:hypothetical protein